jgi:hypothetical protein
MEEWSFWAYNCSLLRDVASRHPELKGGDVVVWVIAKLKSWEQAVEIAESFSVRTHLLAPRSLLVGFWHDKLFVPVVRSTLPFRESLKLVPGLHGLELMAFLSDSPGALSTADIMVARHAAPDAINGRSWGRTRTLFQPCTAFEVCGLLSVDQLTVGGSLD